MGVRFGYTILYVPDVVATVSFYEAAFGLRRRFVHESDLYAEMETGQTALAFASETMAELNGFAIRANRKGDLAAGFEIALVCSAPHEAYHKAVAAGAAPVKPPEEKPWGQVVGYVRDLNGCLVELCSELPA
ncbi:VOC family protein [Ensifer adhaerens]|uniref:VOC family protein n=1 Tax=Ensifer adhaerens TaxID=106592 RepID=UPI0018F83B19|nr:VOC family protein [Ensifer adhaerens]